jgi:hypothetical protein
MEVLADEQVDQVNGGFAFWAVLTVIWVGAASVNAAFTGFIDGARDAFNGLPHDRDANMEYAQ